MSQRYDNALFVVPLQHFLAYNPLKEVPYFIMEQSMVQLEQ